MIALLKLFKKSITKDDGTSHYVTGAQPYAIYENGELLYINNVSEAFPNSGKIFVPYAYSLPLYDSFKLFELEESSTFDESNFRSAKYALKTEVSSLSLIEVIDIDELYETQKYKIAEFLQRGLSFEFIPSPCVLFRTSDDYLIGPVQLEENEQRYFPKEDNFVNCYKNNISIFNIKDSFNNSIRLFSVEKPREEDLVGCIDIAKNERVISDALKQLKDNEEFGELSRRVISRLRKWYGSNEFQDQELHLKERLYRAINLIETNTLDEETTKKFIAHFLDMDASQQVIRQQVNESFKKEYEKFQEQNKKLIKEVSIYREQLMELEEELRLKRIKIQQTNKQFTSIKENMYSEMELMKDNFASVYSKQLEKTMLPAITSSEISHTSSSNKQKIFSSWQTLDGVNLNKIEDFKENLQKNLEIFNGKDSNNNLASTILAGIILGEPILIYGKHSLDFAKCIAYTISSGQTLTLIPELENFSLTEVQSYSSEFTQKDTVKTLILQNPHTTTALFSLPSYLNEQKWNQGMLQPDLTLITLNMDEESDMFIEKMFNSPLIEADNYIKTPMTPFKLKQLQASSLMLNTLDEYIIVKESKKIRKNFREWIEIEQDLDLEVPISSVIWLQQLNAFIENEDDLFEWYFKVFQKVIKPIEQNRINV